MGKDLEKEFARRCREAGGSFEVRHGDGLVCRDPDDLSVMKKYFGF